MAFNKTRSRGEENFNLAIFQMLKSLVWKTPASSSSYALCLHHGSSVWFSNRLKCWVTGLKLAPRVRLSHLCIEFLEKFWRLLFLCPGSKLLNSFRIVGLSIFLDRDASHRCDSWLNRQFVCSPAGDFWDYFRRNFRTSHRICVMMNLSGYFQDFFSIELVNCLRNLLISVSKGQSISPVLSDFIINHPDYF